jgi:NADPH:quinone reductase-like Zn-dependent oxidoreductase
VTIDHLENTVTYKCILVTRRGGLKVIKIAENELRPPDTGELRIKILASPVCQDDVAVRVGNRPFLAKPPFTPGYSIMGVVDAVGEGVTGFAVSDRVAKVKPGDKVLLIGASGGVGTAFLQLGKRVGDWQHCPARTRIVVMGRDRC